MLLPALPEGALPVGVSMGRLAQPWWEFVLGGTLVYGSLLVLSTAVQNSMNTGDNTVGAGLILVLTLVPLNGRLGWLTARSKRMEANLDGTPGILVHNGITREAVLSRARISRQELMGGIRQVGLAEPSRVWVAILENRGRISVTTRNDGHTP